jgi:hypothetical protein
MYVRTHAGLGQAELLSAPPAGKTYSPPFTKGGQPIEEDDRDKLLTILSGPSPYQDYILRVMKDHRAALPRKFFRVVTSLAQVPERLRRRFTRTKHSVVAGAVDRWTGTIYMLEARQVEGGKGPSFSARLELALHEAVHLFGHPFIARVDEGTFQAAYGTGFGEGATQVITEEIMAAQGISKYAHEKPYDEFTPPVRQFINTFSLDAFARAYFWGQTRQLTEAMESRWGPSWRNVANFTSSKKTRMALDEIKRLETAYRRRPVHLRWVFR